MPVFTGISLFDGTMIASVLYGVGCWNVLYLVSGGEFR